MNIVLMDILCLKNDFQVILDVFAEFLIFNGPIRNEIDLNSQ